MMFWIKNIVFAGVLIILAVYLIANEEELFPDEDTPTEEVQADASTAAKPKTDKPRVNRKQTNAAAKGLSTFYANLRGSDDTSDGPRVRNNIVYLPPLEGDLVELLEAKRLTTRPLRRTWRSDKENRPFRPGHTLHQKLREYAEKEGLDVIWWLDRDFLIKDPFRINKDIVDTAHQVGVAIDGHFQDGLSSYFCYQQRTLVLIEEEEAYLDEECIKLPRKKRSREY